MNPAQSARNPPAPRSPRWVKVNALIYSMLEYENMNSVYREFFPVHPPARTVCGAGLYWRPQGRDRMRRAGLSNGGWSDDRRC